MRGLASSVLVLILLMVALPPTGGSSSGLDVSVSPATMDLFDDETAVVTVRVTRDGQPVGGALVTPFPDHVDRFSAPLVVTSDTGQAVFRYTPPRTPVVMEEMEGFAVSHLADTAQTHFAPVITPAAARAPIAKPGSAWETEAPMIALGAGGLVAIVAAVAAGRIRARPVAGIFRRAGAAPFHGAMALGVLALGLILGGILNDSSTFVLFGVIAAAGASGLAAYAREDGMALVASMPDCPLDTQAGRLAHALGDRVKTCHVGAGYRGFDLTDGTRILVERGPERLNLRVRGAGAHGLATELAPVLSGKP